MEKNEIEAALETSMKSLAVKVLSDASSQVQNKDSSSISVCEQKLYSSMHFTGYAFKSCK